jgi:hypothetical protein
MPHAAKGRPADDVAAIVDGFLLSSAHPCDPFPSPALSYLSTSSYSSSLLLSSNRNSPLYSPPPPPSPSRPVIVCKRTPARIPAEALTCTTPGPRAGCRSRGWPYRRPTTVLFELLPPSASSTLSSLSSSSVLLLLVPPPCCRCCHCRRHRTIRNGIMPHLWGINLSHIYAREVR